MDEPHMTAKNITEKDISMSQVCQRCPVCNHARKNQGGMAYMFVKAVESSLCPYCQAYERVHGRKAYEQIK
jgi:hypothetical protein